MKASFIGGERTWFIPWSFLGADFNHNYLSSRFWLAGGNPYEQSFGDPVNARCAYPPVVLYLFTWCRFFTFPQALAIWTFSSAAILAAGTVRSLSARTNLGLKSVAMPFAIAAILLSTPALFALERGNCDSLILLLLLVVVWSLSRRQLLGDVITGGALGLAGWIKPYPVLVIPGLLLFRRPRAFTFAGIAYAAMGLLFLKGNLAAVRIQREWLEIFRSVELQRDSHSLSLFWPKFWDASPLPQLASIPGIVASALLLAPLVTWASLAIYRCRQRDRLMYPYLLWLTAALLFWTPITADYKLIFLPLAALAVWDDRDPLYVHLFLAPFLVYLQPFSMSIGLWPLFGAKLLALSGVAISLVQKARQLNERPDQADALDGATALLTTVSSLKPA